MYRLLNRMVELQILREERVKIQGQKWTVPALNPRPRQLRGHEQDDADRRAIGFDNPRENSAAAGEVLMCGTVTIYVSP